MVWLKSKSAYYLGVWSYFSFLERVQDCKCQLLAQETDNGSIRGIAISSESTASKKRKREDEIQLTSDWHVNKPDTEYKQLLWLSEAPASNNGWVESSSYTINNILISIT